MTGQPIFVHSLFRAGSTYVFSAFRRAGDYTCYYEPMHELVAWAAEDPGRLSLEGERAAGDQKKMQALHHPEMGAPYFQEVRDAWPAWRDTITPSMVYRGYFADDAKLAGVGFYEALAGAAPARPLFADCRTSGRIGMLKQAMGGLHVYLWRNPWDQWWSYRLDSYFDVANRVILHASPLPPALTALVKARALMRAPEDTYSEARDFYLKHPLDDKDSYALFYALWCLAGLEAERYADIDINIDALSERDDYRSELLRQLEGHNVLALDFDDARSPVAVYTDAEQSAFTDIEAEVEQLLVASGVATTAMAQLRQRRNDAAPERRAGPTDARLASQRQIILRGMRDAAESSRRWAGALHEMSREAETFRRAFDHRDKSLRAAHQQIAELERTLADQAARRSQAEQLAELRATEIDRLNATLAAVYASGSWRLTAPLRWVVAVLLLLAQGPEGRVHLLRAVAARVGRYPQFAALLHRALAKWPWLYRRLAVIWAGPEQQGFSAALLTRKLSPRALELQQALVNRLQRSAAEAANANEMEGSP